MKILIVKTSSMGDVIHTLPAITDLARAIPELTIDWVVEESFQEIPRWHPAIRNVFPCALRRWRKHPLKTLRSEEWKIFYHALRKEHYDFVIDCQGLAKSALITRLARGTRCGFDFSSVREKVANFAYDKSFSVSKEQHAIDRNRELLSKVIGYNYAHHTIDYGIAANNIPHPNPPPQAGEGTIKYDSLPCVLTGEGWGGGLPRNYIMFMVNTSMKNKYWSLQGWRTLLEKTAEKNIPVVLPAGYLDEKNYVDSIVEGFSHVTVLPLSSLSLTKSVIAHADAIVSVDTGLSHLSAALNKPTIVLYTATDPKKIGTRGQYQHHLQAVDGQTIEVDEVWMILSALL